MIRSISLACATLLVSNFAVANPEAESTEKPSFSASHTATLSATVKAIDHATRVVTLEGANGQTATITVSEEARNLPQVQVGDQVLAEVTEEVSVKVFANPEVLQPGSGEFVAAARTEMGEMPGGAIQDTVVISGIVEAINLEANTFQLRFEDGVVKEFTARDPENLKKGAVGDMVVITVTQALGIVVERPAAE